MPSFIRMHAKSGGHEAWTVERQGAVVRQRWTDPFGATTDREKTFQPIRSPRGIIVSTAEQVATAWMREEILAQTRKGYQVPRRASQELLATDFSALPFQYQWMEPTPWLAPALRNRFSYTWLMRFLQGVRVYLVVGNEGEVEIYLATMQVSLPMGRGRLSQVVPWVTHGVYTLAQQGGLPPCSILRATLTAFSEDGAELFGHLYNVLMRPDAEDAVEVQQRQGPLVAVIEDIFFLGGEPWYKTPLRAHIGHIQDLCRGQPHLLPPELCPATDLEGYGDRDFSTNPATFDLDANTQSVLAHADRLGYTGWIVLDPDKEVGVPYDRRQPPDPVDVMGVCAIPERTCVLAAVDDPYEEMGEGSIVTLYQTDSTGEDLVTVGEVPIEEVDGDLLQTLGTEPGQTHPVTVSYAWRRYEEMGMVDNAMMGVSNIEYAENAHPEDYRFPCPTGSRV